MNRLGAVMTITTLPLVALSDAQAGIVLEFEHRFPGDRAPLAASAQVEPDRLRVDFGERTMIYRQDKGLLWLVEPRERRYTELTRAHLKVLAGQMAALRTQLSERMKNLPPEKRAAAEQLMGEAGGVMPKGAAHLEKTSRTQTIAGLPCTVWESRRAAGTPQQLCIADWKAAGMTASDLVVLQQFGEFLSEMGPMAEKLAFGLAQTYTGPGAMPGLPVRVATPIGNGELVDEVKAIRRAPIPADRFELPPGLTAQPVGGAQQRPAGPPSAPGAPAAPPKPPG